MSQQLIWKTIEEFQDFEASNFGNIRKKSTQKHLAFHLRNGYYACSIYKHTKNVHRIIATTFIENDDPSLIVNHIDGNKLNNNINNLEWVTFKENTKHALENNLVKKNSRKVGQYDLENKLIKEFDSITEAAKELNISDKHIGSVCRGNKKTAYGFIWKYTDETFNKIKIEDLKNPKQIEDFPNYYITEDKQIYSVKRNGFMKKKIMESGYEVIGLSNNGKKEFYVHVLYDKYFKQSEKASSHPASQ
jgi:hypothetical protein